MDNEHYFTASTFKLIVMSICTFGFYELYWFYKNWQFISVRDEVKMRPFWRAALTFFLSYVLFSDVKKEAQAEGKQSAESIHAGIFAIVYIMIWLAWKLGNPFWLLSIFTFLPLLKVNQVAMELNRDMVDDYEENSTLSGKGGLIALLSGTVFAFAVLGTILSG